jgi:hypothetical protein
LTHSLVDNGDFSVAVNRLYELPFLIIEHAYSNYSGFSSPVLSRFGFSYVHYAAWLAINQHVAANA